MTITVRRTGALGDVLCVTPVLSRLRRDHPTAKIVVETAYPVALEGHPSMVAQQGFDLLGNLYYDLDLAYERMPDTHVVDAYFWHVLGEIVPAAEKSLNFARSSSWNNENVAVIHAAKSWPSRTFLPQFWNEVAERLRNLGLKPVFVGGASDYGGPLWATNALTRLHLKQVAALIAGASVFVGSDSALIHLAGTTDTPIVGLYTSVRAKYRMPYRYGELGWKTIGLEPGADLECRGCLERIPAPVQNMICARGDNICTRSIPAVSVIDAVKELTGRTAVRQQSIVLQRPR